MILIAFRSTMNRCSHFSPKLFLEEINFSIQTLSHTVSNLLSFKMIGLLDLNKAIFSSKICVFIRGNIWFVQRCRNENIEHLNRKHCLHKDIESNLLEKKIIFPILNLTFFKSFMMTGKSNWMLKWNLLKMITHFIISVRRYFGIF